MQNVVARYGVLAALAILAAIVAIEIKGTQKGLGLSRLTLTLRSGVVSLSAIPEGEIVMLDA